MKTKIEGSVMQIIRITLEDGEKVFSESGAMVWMSDNINMKTGMRGGIMAGFGRMMSGESIFLTEFKSNGKGEVVFAVSAPGKILEVNIEEGRNMICQKDAFLVAQDGVELKAEFHKRLGAGMFGGEGFFLQKLSGNGKAFVEIDGEVFEKELKEGEKILVDTGCIAMFEPSVHYNITLVKGVRNILLGGEGLFLAELKGPGKVWLQSMPIKSLAHRILPFIPGK
ncbi:TIGR00266 family protein [Candidatus Micrarchaeota archaeon]|nr:TIGR00266 family protein [Candidatus Micrarchaeota archaeon]